MIWVRRAADHVHAAWGRRCKGERGASLIIAMGFLGLLSVSVVSMLVLTMANFTTTTTVRGANAGLYGADGGVDVGVQVLRAQATYCPDSAAGTQSLPSQTINGRTVNLTCQTLSGSTGGGSGGGSTSWPTAWPFVLTGYNGKSSSSTFKTSGSTGNNITATFQGPAFIGGGMSFAGGSDAFVFSGTLDQYDPYCSSDKPGSPGKPTVTGTWTCRNSGSYAVPDPNPTLKVPTAAAPAPVTQGSCTIFFPGKYTSAPSFSTSSNYMASGVYYFENTSKVQFEGQVFGGEPAAFETKRFTGNTPCSTDAAAKVLAPTAAINGKGVQLVFGGSAWFEPKSNSSTQIELYAREPGIPANEGTPYVSMYAPPSSGPNYIASSTNAFNSGGSAYQLVVHGLVYMPNSFPKIWGVNNWAAGGAAVFDGGLVLAAINVAINATMTTQTFAKLPTNPPVSSTDRTVVVTSTAATGGGGETTQTVKAVVLFPANGSAPTVLSWRKL